VELNAHRGAISTQTRTRVILLGRAITVRYRATAWSICPPPIIIDSMRATRRCDALDEKCLRVNFACGFG